MKRRQFLPLVGGSLTLLAGCATVTPRTARAARIDAITLVNDDVLSHTIDVTIEEDEVVKWSGTYQLGAGTPTAKIRERAPLSESGQFSVRAVLDGSTEVVAEPAFAVKGEGHCAHVWFLVGDGGKLSVERIDSNRECEYV